MYIRFMPASASFAINELSAKKMELFNKIYDSSRGEIRFFVLRVSCVYMEKQGKLKGLLKSIQSRHA